MQQDSARPSMVNSFRAKTSTAALFFAILISAFGRANAQVTTSAGVTPTLMMGFTGKILNKTAQLNWTMESQTNCKWFVVERSGDNGGFDSISVVIGLNNGNTNGYNFFDPNMLEGNNYYRLREVDMDGVTRYSKVLTLNNVEASTKMAIYPNPAIATLNFSVSSPAAQQVIVQVYNLSGIVLLTSQQMLNAGSNQQTVAINGLKSGNYILKVSSRTGASQYVQPFVKIM
ncbi:MAG TPA: T9SS type A sorting domain-containing protein [Puia sp.]